MVTRVWVAENSLAYTLSDFHGLRYILVLPIFKLSNWIGVSYDWLFSVTVPALIFAITYYSTKSTQKLDGQKSQTRQALIFSEYRFFSYSCLCS